jgi:hypothetical protein
MQGYKADSKRKRWLKNALRAVSLNNINAAQLCFEWIDAILIVCLRLTRSPSLQPPKVVQKRQTAALNMI